jgi:hypothetical protein
MIGRKTIDQPGNLEKPEEGIYARSASRHQDKKSPPAPESRRRNDDDVAVESRTNRLIQPPTGESVPPYPLNPAFHLPRIESNCRTIIRKHSTH